jgi:ABC-type branched-subunit amino acid transport system substrate-binding protein
MPVRLPDPAASRAVLIGVDTYDDLDDLPAVAHNIERLAELLSADDLWGLPSENVTVLANPTSKDHVLDAVHTAATEADDALLFYFAGHGLLTADAGLRLALPHTDVERLYRGVAYDDVRELLVHTGRAQARVVILDCCYSGSALTGYMGAGAGTGMADHTMAEGTYVMTASAETKPAMAPPGEKYTAFTGELLRVIDEGVPGGPDPLPMDVLFTEVRARLAARPGIPVPQQRARNKGYAVALVRNRWGTRSAEPAVPIEEATPPVRPPVRGRRVRLLHPLLVLAAVVSLPFVVASSAVLGGSGDRCRSWTAPEHGESGECLGVSDGSHSFMTELDGVSKAIARANASIPDDAPFVTIALLAQLSPIDALTVGRTVRQVQGAYAAQRRINALKTAPYVRLVLAHPGDWALAPKTIEHLKKMSGSKEDNLRAVVGFDGYDETIGKAVQALTDRGIPAIAGAFTPNEPKDHGLGDRPIAWVVPSADDQASALKGVVAKRRSILVWDENARAFGKDLFEAFGTHLGVPARTARYTGYLEEAKREGEFTRIADQMCELNADVDNVLFAGDPTDLRDLVRALGNRKCRHRDVTVVTGSEASALHLDPELDWGALRGGVTVKYTSGVHHDGPGPGMEQLRDFVKKHVEPDVGAVDLTDGETIAAYDSTLMAAQAIRRMSTPDGKVPGLSAVTARFLDLNFALATGPVCFDDRGRALNRAVHVLRLDPADRAPKLVTTAYPRPGRCG